MSTHEKYIRKAIMWNHWRPIHDLLHNTNDRTKSRLQSIREAPWKKSHVQADYRRLSRRLLIILEVKYSYDHLYASQSPPLELVLRNPATLMRYYTDELPYISVEEVKLALKNTR